jgi:hypothetical protein
MEATTKTVFVVMPMHNSAPFLAIDGIETGFGDRIPLWMFGLLY